MDSSIGNQIPIANEEEQFNPIGQIEDRTYYYQKFCSSLLDRNQRIGRIKTHSEGIVLSIENIVFDKEELYFVIQIENRSTLDYDLNFLNFSVETRQKGARKSLQSLYQEPLFIHNRPTKIVKGKTSRLVYVMPKFSLSTDRRVVLELNEENGERNLKLKVSHDYINNPN